MSSSQVRCAHQFAFISRFGLYPTEVTVIGLCARLVRCCRCCRQYNTTPQEVPDRGTSECERNEDWHTYGYMFQ